MQLRDAIASSPLLFPLRMNASGDLIEFVRMTEQDYQQASFLDERMLQPNQQRAVISWQELQPAAQGLPLDCDFIFHVSHCGSTLISRLLGAHPQVLSLREPALLRQCAAMAWPDQLRICLGLWSRTFTASQRSLIKATSYVNAIAPQLMSLVTRARALLVYVPLATFLPGLLDGAMVDIHSQLASRLIRLRTRAFTTSLQAADLSPGESVAASWLAEMLDLREIAARFPERSLWLDFDEFLRQPQPLANAIAQHLGLPAGLNYLTNSSLMQCYAKRPEVTYDADFRARLLAKSRAEHAAEIHRGLEWIRRLEMSNSWGLPLQVI